MKLFEVQLGRSEEAVVDYAVARSADHAVDIVIRTLNRQKTEPLWNRDDLVCVAMLLKGARVLISMKEAGSPRKPFVMKESRGEGSAPPEMARREPV